MRPLTIVTAGAVALTAIGTDHGAAPDGPGGGPELRVHWAGSRAATIERHEAARVYISQASFNDVHFTFKTFPASPETR